MHGAHTHPPRGQASACVIEELRAARATSLRATAAGLNGDQPEQLFEIMAPLGVA
jgi:hypothetical protein